MSRPSYTEAASFANRSDNVGTSLKTPAAGGPSYKQYPGVAANVADTRYQAHSDFSREHPRYPDYQYPDDKARDTYYEAKMALAAAQPTGMVMASDKDINYVIDKKNAQEMVLFKQFVEDSIPRGTPWAKEYFERIMPGWYQSKIDIIQDKLAIVNRFIDITVRGPQNIEDMFLLYQLYTGKFSLPADWTALIRPTEQGVDFGNFASGLFNPKRRIKQQLLISKQNQAYMANFAIPGIDIKNLTAGAAAGSQTVDVTANAFNDQTTPYAAASSYSTTLPRVNENYFGNNAISRWKNIPNALLYKTDAGNIERYATQTRVEAQRASNDNAAIPAFF